MSLNPPDFIGENQDRFLSWSLVCVMFLVPTPTLRIFEVGRTIQFMGLRGNYDHLFGVKLQNLSLAEYLWKERP